MDGSPRSLILLRHAKSDWSGVEVDLLRPLAARGRRQAPEAGRWLAANVGRVDLAVVSPASRARETWQLASAELAERPATRFDTSIYAACGAVLLDVVQGLPDQAKTLIVVGHNPGIEDLASTLAGRRVAMPTSGLAVISVSGAWSTTGPASATLRASGRPPTDEPPC
jgi:phosphohistidine phosphatase